MPGSNSVDERLMAASAQDRERQGEAVWADKLRQEQASAQDTARQESAVENDPVAIIKKGVVENKKKEAEKTKKESLEKKMSAVHGNPATSGLLRWMWGLLIPSFGLSLVYINIHVFCNKIFGDMLFCKLGDEWKMPGAAGLNQHGSMANLVELMGLLFLDLVAFFLIMFGFITFALVVDIIEHPMQYLGTMFYIIYSLIKSKLGIN